MHLAKDNHTEFAAEVSRLTGRSVVPTTRLHTEGKKVTAKTVVFLHMDVDTPKGVETISIECPLEMAAIEAATHLMLGYRMLFLPWAKTLHTIDDEIYRMCRGLYDPYTTKESVLALTLIKRRLSEEEKFESMVRAGILTEDGELHPRYRSDDD